ncbi:hypothetical protein GCM10022252_76040 [Streptosporangium oxazolinicum]|uniref:Uncharacterized protein n=1 Tax=Streptosporangium oxazolinicum TaxID=909287 RepID=A0ABP8BKY3_9ACTN
MSRRNRRMRPGTIRHARKPRWSKKSRCPETGKVRYTSKGEAAYWRSRLHLGDRKQVYVCEHCGFRHLGRPFWRGTRRHSWGQCPVDPSPAYRSEAAAAAQVIRIGGAMVAPCRGHWHVTPLPVV